MELSEIFLFLKDDLRNMAYGLQYFCQIGQLSNDFKTKNGTIVKQDLLNLRADSHTGQLSKTVDSHPGKLSNIIFGSQPPRTIVKLHF